MLRDTQKIETKKNETQFDFIAHIVMKKIKALAACQPKNNLSPMPYCLTEFVRLSYVNFHQGKERKWEEKINAVVMIIDSVAMVTFSWCDFCMLTKYPHTHDTMTIWLVLGVFHSSLKSHYEINLCSLIKYVSLSPDDFLTKHNFSFSSHYLSMCGKWTLKVN